MLKEIWIDTGEDYSSSKKKWRYGYDKEIDAVVISTTGKIGKVVVIDDLRIALPKQPGKSKILNYGKKKENQRWERKPLPQELKGIEDSDTYEAQGVDFKKKWDPYIDKEFDRRANGVWVYINGEAVYLTGSHYMFCQWNSIGGSAYPNYRFSQRVLWTHWEACVADNRSFGQCYLKNRRSGYTTMEMSDSLEFSTRTEDADIGIMSKTSKDARNAYLRMIIPAFKRYPFFFKPLTDGSTNPKTELSFRAPSQKITKTNRVMGVNPGLNTTISHFGTALNSMDGMKILRMKLDEIGKWPPDVPFNEYWQIAMECLTLGGRIVGKCMAGSTANSSKKGGAEFKDIYYDSKIETRDDILQQTKSGMYSLFIPSEYNLAQYIDSFGNPILEDNPDGVVNEFGELVYIGSKTFLKGRRLALKDDPDKLNEELRKNPSTEDDAFRDPSSDSTFNLTKLYEQQEYNKNLTHAKVTRGKFEWIEKYKSVRWMPDPNGKVIVRWLPRGKYRNNIEYRNGKMYPGNYLHLTAGIDSYDISKTVDSRSSNGSMHVYLKEGLDEEVSNEFVCEYVDRPQVASQFYDNCLKIAVFYGCQVLIENNKPRILFHFRENGFREYSANRPDKTWKKLTATEKNLGGIPNSSEGTKLWHAESIERYIDRHVGINRVAEHGEIGAMGSCFFDELITDWIGFDINNRTEYDRSISSGLALMLAYHKIRERRKIDPEVKFEYFKKYKVI